MTQREDNKRIAKNTLILYCRMFITMAIGMWTSRLVINALGFTDQGVYNVVGGFVGLASLLTASIYESIGRFITFTIGQGKQEEVNKAVCNAITVQWTLAGIVLILAETVGLWFLTHKLVIPPEREFAAHVVYQLSIGSTIVSLISSAPNALIYAYEKVGIYAKVAIANSLAALGIGLSITYFGGDRLILYSSLQFIIVVLIRIFYYIYIKRTFPKLKLKFRFNKEIFYPIFNFAAWNGIGTGAAILRSSGTSILLNMFGGPIANTINGIANSVSTLATLFVSDFTRAFSPQITKRYASGDNSLIPFVTQCSKFSFGLMMVMAVPVFFNAEILLTLWLKKIPEGTIIFARLILIYLLIETISRPIIIAKNATGKIRNYQLIVGGILLMTIPLTYLFLKVGLPIYFSYISIIITSSVAFCARMLMLRGDIRNWSSVKFIKTTVFPCFISLIIASIIPSILFYTFNSTIISCIFQCIIGFLWCCVVVYFITCNRSERNSLIYMLKGIKQRVFKNHNAN